MRSGESARLPPLWPGFDSRHRSHMWVEFVVGSRPCSKGYSPGSPVFLPLQKTTLQIPFFDRQMRVTGLSALLLVLPSLSKVNLFTYLFTCEKNGSCTFRFYTSIVKVVY